MTAPRFHWPFAKSGLIRWRSTSTWRSSGARSSMSAKRTFLSDTQPATAFSAVLKTCASVFLSACWVKGNALMLRASRIRLDSTMSASGPDASSQDEGFRIRFWRSVIFHLPVV